MRPPLNALATKKTSFFINFINVFLMFSNMSIVIILKQEKPEILFNFSSIM